MFVHYKNTLFLAFYKGRLSFFANLVYLCTPKAGGMGRTAPDGSFYKGSFGAPVS